MIETIQFTTIFISIFFLCMPVCQKFTKPKRGIKINNSAYTIIANTPCLVSLLFHTITKLNAREFNFERKKKKKRGKFGNYITKRKFPLITITIIVSCTTLIRFTDAHLCRIIAALQHRIKFRF